ncbi:MAG TPA: hypothetical protein VD838_17400, partial [Anaeromyxobacteraceae bacterium]|nr:hypothetical protein [Anaeromyxobacteraceae bacterium]
MPFPPGSGAGIPPGVTHAPHAAGGAAGDGGGSRTFTRGAERARRTGAFAAAGSSRPATSATGGAAVGAVTTGGVAAGAMAAGGGQA